MKFQVITRVPEPGDLGNQAVCLDVWLEKAQPGPENEYKGEYQRLGDALGNPMIALALRAPVFHLGEVLIVDDDGGRELVGHGRKADKWDVSTETFDTAEEAVARAQALGE